MIVSTVASSPTRRLTYVVAIDEDRRRSLQCRHLLQQQLFRPPARYLASFQARNDCCFEILQWGQHCDGSAQKGGTGQWYVTCC